MKPIHELKNARAELIRKATAIRDGAKASDRELSEDETTKIESNLAAVETLDAEINAAEAKQKREQRLASLDDLSKSVEQPSNKTVQNVIKDAAAELPKYVVPAEARVTRVRNFVGPDADYKAYAFGTWLSWAYKPNQKQGAWLASNGFINMEAAQYQSANSAGGFLTPPTQFVPDLIRLVEEYGVIRRNARNWPMSGDNLEVPRRTSGLTAYFTAEANADSATAITPSSMAGTTHSLNAKKLATLTYISRELLADAPLAVGDVVAAEIALAFANKEDECGFNGTGTSTYGGIQGVMSFVGSASIVDAATGNTGFETLDNDDFAKCIGKLPRYALQGAKWYISGYGWGASMLRLASNAGGNTMQNLTGNLGLSYLGFPVEISQVLNSTAGAQTSTKVAVFGNLTQGVSFGSRSNIEIAISDDFKFSTDQVSIRGTERFDIGCHTFDSTSAAGPVVVLKTAAS